jgi:hypothetical protein
MNQRPSLREALARADVAELDEKADALGREIGQALAVALEEQTPQAPERYKPNEEEERDRLRGEAMRDASRAVEQQRDRLGRRLTSTHDAKVMLKIFELLRSMAAEPDGGDFQ